MTCKHDEVDFTDDDTRGVCLRCGAECDWHWEKEVGNVGNYYWSGNERIIDTWYDPYDLGE